ncbi:MAG TPA: nuclear transport factor 2 family protein [Candidatus Acidoferrum sp.]|nr:nuclear transport factor 2 family protein [Candidatus Acidoferrum sp.]
MRKFFVIVSMLLAANAATMAQQPSAAPSPVENQEVRLALEKFFAAFSNLDWPAFRACFDDSATVFHPSAAHMRRTDSPSEFDTAWREVFDRIRKQSGRSKPPYMDLNPADLNISVLAPGVALVTFHLPGAEVFGRRTIVLKKFADGWKIVHIHASNFALSSPTAR